jgi:hypothetical protein
MSDIRMTDKAIRETEERFALEREAMHILKLVVAEWSSDPASVKCFDLRIVNRAKEILARLKKLDPFFDM